MKPLLTTQAEIDLANIWDYIASESGNPEIARAFIHRLTSRFTLISQNPYIGRSRLEFGIKGLRSFPVGDYLIFYRYNQGVRILRVLHGNRDLYRLLNDN